MLSRNRNTSNYYDSLAHCMFAQIAQVAAGRSPLHLFVPLPPHTLTIDECISAATSYIVSGRHCIVSGRHCIVSGRHCTYVFLYTNVFPHRMGQDDTLLFNLGLFVFIRRDSAIFRSGWSLALYMTLTLSGIEDPDTTLLLCLSSK